MTQLRHARDARRQDPIQDPTLDRLKNTRRESMKTRKHSWRELILCTEQFESSTQLRWGCIETLSKYIYTLISAIIDSIIVNNNNRTIKKNASSKHQQQK